MDSLNNPSNYYEQSEDEDYSYSRRVIPQPDTGRWEEVPSDIYRLAVSDISEPDNFSSTHKVVERPASPLQFTTSFTASHTVQFSPHSNPIPTILQYRFSSSEQLPQQPPQDQMEGPMWDPACLVSPACEETRSIYRLSTPPTPLLDEPMPSPQKPSPVKERLQTVTEQVEVVKEVIVKKESRKVQSRSDLLAQALEQTRLTSPAIAKSEAQPPPADQRYRLWSLHVPVL